jgi:hypothetical protein
LSKKIHSVFFRHFFRHQLSIWDIFSWKHNGALAAMLITIKKLNRIVTYVLVCVKFWASPTIG